MKPNPLWTNRWQVIHIGTHAVSVRCAHRYHLIARACAALRDLHADSRNIGRPVADWHEVRPTPEVTGWNR